MRSLIEARVSAKMGFKVIKKGLTAYSVKMIAICKLECCHIYEVTFKRGVAKVPKVVVVGLFCKQKSDIIYGQPLTGKLHHF